ncbi:MAG: hypothetical protein J0G96_10770 [Flavobacteriia bacterium]|nr:hypothetical protein [Flavobacteriia bacterium]OJX34952.1 MAG: hypothetical protein BGO87_09445 [Flavobacteriia bacterium 40-80]
MKKLLCLLAVAMLVSCSNYGDKLEFDGTEIFYTDGATKEQAEKLGNYLQKEGFTDGTKKSVQLVVDKKSGKLTFRMVTSKETAKDEQYNMIFESFSRNISKEFGMPVNFQLCDELFNTIRTIEAKDVPRSVTVGQTEIIYDKSVSNGLAQKLADFLADSQFSEEDTPKTVQLEKIEKGYIFKMVVKPDFQNNEDYFSVLKVFGKLMSISVFNEAPVTIHVCDEYMNTLNVVE